MDQGARLGLFGRRESDALDSLSTDRRGAGAGARVLVDPFGRRIDYLRLSVTDRCDLRCVYCMPADQKFLPKKDVLTLDEIDRLGSAFVRLGVRKLRLSGGEPLVRRGFADLVRALSRHLASGALDELTLTTNGMRLAEHAEALAAAGVKRVNVSLDSLDPDTFKRLTRGGDVTRVIAGIDAALRRGAAGQDQHRRARAATMPPNCRRWSPGRTRGAWMRR